MKPEKGKVGVIALSTTILKMNPTIKKLQKIANERSKREK
jgi:hypothetical protein